MKNAPGAVVAAAAVDAGDTAVVAAAAVAAVVVAAAGIGIDTCQGPATAGRLGWAEISTGVSCSR